ncbi:MAG TPA: molybdopterin-guanine dinucleotide biosynthesis protein B, partial [Sedimentisphaerales bacterium]
MCTMNITPPIFCIVGWSGSGKTTLLEALLPLLAAKKNRVNVMKHSHHDLVLEPPHKDSARLRAAGATEVMLSSPYRYMIAHELRSAAEPTLDELVARLAPADLILVEGYKWAAIPKIEIHRPALGKPAQYLDDAHIVAVAS